MTNRNRQDACSTQFPIPNSHEPKSIMAGI
jgi:hypothetical protein